MEEMWKIKALEAGKDKPTHFRVPIDMSLGDFIKILAEYSGFTDFEIS